MKFHKSAAAGLKSGQFNQKATLWIHISYYWMWERFLTAIDSVWHTHINEVSYEVSGDRRENLEVLGISV